MELAASERGRELLDDRRRSPGTATTYTGLPVAGAKVRVARGAADAPADLVPLVFSVAAVRLPTGRRSPGARQTTAADGSFTIRFPAMPDRSVPKDALPVFTYRVVADVTDSGGETRTDERSMSAGYADVEAAIVADAWHAVMPDARDPQGGRRRR